MIDFIQQAPAWIIDNRWALGGMALGALMILTGTLMLNPRDRQLREWFRRR